MKSKPMKNFIIRTITGIIFVAAIVSCFLRPEAMVLLFSIITGLTVWEFTGLVNEREDVTVNRFISTVAGVYFFYAMTYYCSDSPTLLAHQRAGVQCYQ